MLLDLIRIVGQIWQTPNGEKTFINFMARHILPPIGRDKWTEWGAMPSFNYLLYFMKMGG